jgi:phospholipid/cholesterol/gamma-HCH transport system substrate-binding protein
MKRENANYLMVGTIVILVLGLFLYILYRLTGGVGENDPYHVLYTNVGGLNEGTPVTYEGFKVGSVTGITPVREAGGTRYRVDLAVRDGWGIPVDSVARIYSEGLLAETVINIEEGKSLSMLNLGAELQGTQGIDLFTTVNTVAGEVSVLLNETVRPLLENLNSRISGVGDQVDDRLPVILTGLIELLQSLRMSADRLPQLLGETTEEKIGNVLANSERLTSNLLKLSEDLLATRRQLDELLAESQGAVRENRQDIRIAVHALRNSLEAVSAQTDGILQNLDGTTRNLNEFSRQIRQNPGLLLNGKPPVEVGVAHD